MSVRCDSCDTCDTCCACTTASANKHTTHGIRVHTSVPKNVRRNISSALSRPKIVGLVRASLKWEKLLRLRVGNSAMRGAGKGVFTTAPISAGTRVVVCIGTLTDASAQPITCWSMTWHFERTDGKLQTEMCMKSSRHVTRYINSSKTPNCTLEWIADKRVPVVVATRDIAADSELTIGYEF
jgi:hypothetical protein